MCSVNTDETHQMVKGRYLEINESCRKCSEEATVLLRGKDAYCNNCFLVYFIHKFRSTIGKSKQIKPNDRVLVCFSGGKNSSALLHLLREGLDEVSHKKLRFIPTFFHIIENEDEIIHLEKISLEAKKLDFRFYYSHLHQVFNEENLSIFDISENRVCLSDEERSFGDRLTRLLASSGSQTGREDLKLNLTYNLMTRAASQLGFKKMFLGDNATRISERILSHVALGRGSQLSQHVHFKSIHSGIQIYRPMRELLENEIDSYLRIFNISPPILKQIPNDESINLCTKNFISGLQAEFPATVPTIFKTGDKLVCTAFDSTDSLSSIRTDSSDLSSHASFSTSSLKSDATFDCCSVCGFILDIEQGIATALEARHVSSKISKLPSGTEFVAHSGPQSSEVNGQTDCFSPSKQDFENYVCYGCRNIQREMADEEDFIPSLVAKNLQRKLSTDEMKSKFEDFLIS